MLDTNEIVDSEINDCETADVKAAIEANDMLHEGDKPPKKERKTANKKEYALKYYYENKEKINIKQNEKVRCEDCDLDFSRSNIKKHYNSKSHLKKINEKEDSKTVFYKNGIKYTIFKQNMEFAEYLQYLLSCNKKLF
jgi:hypothetical protein